MNEILSVEHLDGVLNNQRHAFNNNPYRSYQQRITDLKNLKKMLLSNQQSFIDAMSVDFGHRSEDDSIVGDILTSISGINYSIKRLKSWMKPKRKHIGLLFQPATGKVIYQPLGVVGIIAPWNYPLFLSVGPLTAALAAGNNAMIKMSEYTPKTSSLLAELLATIYPQDQVAVVGGDVKIASAFSSLKFDHLFFTGSTTVGKLVMKAAAENLVPVTLELGGKSPSIIDSNMDMKTTVSRFILAKTLNSGQTCVAPDYLLCPTEKVNELTLELKKQYHKMYPTVADNMDCTSIVNSAQYNRLKDLLEDAKTKGASLIPLSYDEDNTDLRRMPLTLLLDTTEDMQVMQQEIFGPLLPIVAYDDIDSAISYVNERPRPLALYIFSFNKKFQQKLLLNTHAGGVCINDAAFHVANEDLPFGGIGPSGMGSYHGDEGFKTFSHAKAVLTRGKINLAPLLFPPYGKALHKMIYKIFIR
ncbi:MAG: coniferyl-aldehyde dehydrogenase [Enterobacterales bacterium]|jgi:coniferyl-aldehyde dehydrogenase